MFTNTSYKKFMPSPSGGRLRQDAGQAFLRQLGGQCASDPLFRGRGYNYGKAAGAEDFCRKAQLLNIEVNKAMYEGVAAPPVERRFRAS